MSPEQCVTYVPGCTAQRVGEGGLTGMQREARESPPFTERLAQALALTPRFARPSPDGRG